MNKFKTGDTVTLISGGPLMTVRYYDSSQKCYNCTWYCGESCSFKTYAFFEDTLKMDE